MTTKITFQCSQYHDSAVLWHLWLEACYCEVTGAAIPTTFYAIIKATVQVQNARTIGLFSTFYIFSISTVSCKGRGLKKGKDTFLLSHFCIWIFKGIIVILQRDWKILNSYPDFEIMTASDKHLILST